MYKQNKNANNKNNNNNKKQDRKTFLSEYKVPTPTIVPRFEVDDEAGYKYLEDNGYAVFKSVANEEEIEKGKSLAWDFIEGLGTGIDRNDISTWNNQWPDPFGKGIIAGDGVGQSSFLWFVRAIPNVQKIFASIWNEKELITSFDGFCIHRPYEHDLSWKTKDAIWYHLDQNGHRKPNRLCIQGLLNFYNSGEHDGGLCVIPKSHTIFNKIFNSRPNLAKFQDFIVLANDSELWTKTLPSHGLKPIKICAQPGDFVLWDSRTIHCNAPADQPREIPTDGTILCPRRLVSYVCMTPKSRLTNDGLSKRVYCYKTGQTTSHWPEDVVVASARQNRKYNYIPVPLNDVQKKLIPME